MELCSQLKANIESTLFNSTVILLLSWKEPLANSQEFIRLFLHWKN